MALQWPSNYSKKTPQRWKNVGDFSLIMIPVIMAAIPNLPVSQTAMTWSMQIGSILLVAIKFWTKNKVEETAKPEVATQ